VRFKAGELLTFVVRSPVPVSTVDPNTIYLLRRLGTKKKTRELITSSGHVSPFGASTVRNPDEGAVPVTFSLYGDYSLKLETTALAPGEYALGRPNGWPLFCFGVDDQQEQTGQRRPE
jgi:hypothetical protein